MLFTNLPSRKKFRILARNKRIAGQFANELVVNVQGLKNKETSDFWFNFLADKQMRLIFDGLTSNSPFLANILVTSPIFSKYLFEKGPEYALSLVKKDLAQIDPTDVQRDNLKRLLRVSRKHFALLCAVADYLEVWDLSQITKTLSGFADKALSIATAYLLRQAYDNGELVLDNPLNPEKNSGFICLGMGKLGAQELNYSSDIDLILLYEQIKTNYKGKKSPQEFYNKLARDLVTVLQERTKDGYVFRVDLRLRPDPGSTPAVLSDIAAETYYESVGQNWERAAMIKARPVAGDQEAGRKFILSLTPFIWRKNLDFAAIEDINSIKRQINGNTSGKPVNPAGHNVKLGRGGIRDIELFVQTQQLIWGGRVVTLRSAQTCKCLEELTKACRIDAQVRDDLKDAYEFLRKVEHRLQMINDQQTHEIPREPQKLESIACFLGFKNVDLFLKKMSKILEKVEKHSAALFEIAPDTNVPGTLSFTGSEDQPDTLSTLEQLGYRDSINAAKIIRNWHVGRFRSLRSPRARELLTAMLPTILKALSQTFNPSAALLRFNDFLEGLPAGVQLLSLLRANPLLCNLLAEIMGSAPTLAEMLKRHPILFDTVLTSDFFVTQLDATKLTEHMETQLLSAEGFEDVLDITRRQVNDRIFQTGILVLQGTLSPSAAGEHLVSIADSVLNILYQQVSNKFKEDYGQLRRGEMAVIALGKLGGREMTIGSDLDLLFVYDEDMNLESKGKRPLSTTVFFTRLAQRYLSAISSPTGQGSLYEVDMRLRPSGTAGPIATSLESFIKYHSSASRTWEHMALTRARIVRAPETLKQRLNQAIHVILTRPRDPQTLLSDVAKMRMHIAQKRPNVSILDIKNQRGGLIDIEFITQYLQLRHASTHPDVLNTNTITALQLLTDNGFLENGHGLFLANSVKLWQNLQGILRLTVGEKYDTSSPSDDCLMTVARACGEENFSNLQTRLFNTQAECYEIYKQLIDRPAGEISDKP